jgi:hypothetical protein
VFPTDGDPHTDHWAGRVCKGEFCKCPLSVSFQSGFGLGVCVCVCLSVCLLPLLDLKVLKRSSWCVLSQSLVQVQPGVDIIRTNLEFLQEQFNSIAAHVLHCTGQAGGQPITGSVSCPRTTARIMCSLTSSPQTVDLEPGCWSCVTRACLNAWP